MRLGGPIFASCETPEDWVAAMKAEDYRAAYCPVGPDADDATVRDYAEAARAADIVIAEVPAFGCSPLDPDPVRRKDALTFCQRALDLADRIGAQCAVNVAGSRGPVWTGPHADDMTEDAFDMIVASVREIIDAVKPSRSWYTLETMQWMYPDTVDCYVRLIKAIDRDRFAVHLDPVNLVCSPERFFHNGALIRECFEKLGPRIKSCHAKDIALSNAMTVHLDEARPGLGGLDYGVFLSELAKLGPDTPLMIEHLTTEEEYRLAAQHIRSVAASI